jgi:exodeoxyribonuclease III
MKNKPDPATSAGLTIATWNVNSVKARLAHLLEWLKRASPDIVLLQELKCVEEAFPAMEIEELGYNLAIHGEKTYNGVAILSKFPLSDVQKGLPGNEDDSHARYIEAVVYIPLPLGEGAEQSEAGEGHPHYALTRRYAPPSPRGRGSILRVAAVYVPNGQDAESDKFQYKLKFLDHFAEHMKTLLSYGEVLVVGGDYNIAPEDIDVHNPQEWEGSVLTHDEVRKRFRKILHLGVYDAQVVSDERQVTSKKASASSHYSPLATRHYTWWDYRANAFPGDDGLRIDHLLLSPQAADKITSCEVHRDLRALEKASDHAPVVATFNLT